MKLFTFEANQRRRLGAEWSGQLVDLPLAYHLLISMQGPKPGMLPALPVDLLNFIRLGTPALEAAREALAFIKKRPPVPVGEQLFYLFEGVKILPPIPRPGKILCLEPAESSESRRVFAKLPNTIIGTADSIHKPKQAGDLLSRGALAIVMAKKTKDVSPDQALDFVFGCSTLNDLHLLPSPSSNQSTLRRNLDSFCPFGPALLTADELSVSNPLTLRTFLNGSLIDETTNSHWATATASALGFISRDLTLEPGDVIAIPMHSSSEQPATILGTGDAVALEVNGIGRLENRIVAGFE